MKSYSYPFLDRKEAGEELAAKLLDEPLIKEASKDELLVLSIPRGGVVIGAAVAQMLGCAHDVVVAKKIGFPGQEEAAIGAMAEDGTLVLDPWTRQEFSEYIVQATKEARSRIEALIHKFRQGRVLDLHAKIIIIVDDGIATGETMRAVVTWMTLREPDQRPKKTLIAVPVCSPRTAKQFKKTVDKFICLISPDFFWAISQFYLNFRQVSDEEVVELLRQSTVVSDKMEIKR
jgi:predicted phosphoribosyltransferase